MTEVEKYVEDLIKAVKKDETLKRVRFVKGYSSTYTDSPVKGFLAAVSIDKMKVTEEFIGNYIGGGLKGQEHETTIKIRVYAPFHAGGSGLTQVVMALFNALVKADKNKFIKSKEISSVTYDKNANTIYRTITATLDMFLCEEVMA